MRTSYSAIETYRQCPQRYKFQEIDKIRVPKSREAIFGTLVHSTLKFMFERDPLYPTLDEVIAHFREHWPGKETFEQETRHDPLRRAWTEEEEKAHFEEGVRMIRRFYEKNAPWNFSVVDLESRFEVAVTDEKTGKTHILAGIMDRIDKKSDTAYEIIDYKTSKRMPSQDAVNRNMQLSLYGLGLKKRWPHLQTEEIALSLYFLKHGEKLSTALSEEKTKKAEAYVLKAVGDIEMHKASGKPFEPMPGPLCNWCGYRPMCPAWKHLYKKDKGQTTKDERQIESDVSEYFSMREEKRKAEARIKELGEEIRNFMEQEGLTRVFGDKGVIAQKTVQRFSYDWEKIRPLLEELHKWEDMLKVDETKFKNILKELPEDIRRATEELRTVAKEYSVLTASLKKLGPGQNSKEP